MSDHMNDILRRSAGRGRFTVQPEQSPAARTMNQILRGEQPVAPEAETEPEPVGHNADAAEGRNQSIPRPRPTMNDVIRGHRRVAQRERQEEADNVRAERQHGSDHLSW
jgi:hypothetical protein